MPAPTYTDFASLFVDLATSDTTVQTWITEQLSFVYEHELSPRVWSPDAIRRRGALLYVAHWRALKAAGAEGVGGALVSESVGDWSQTKERAPSPDRAWLMQTGYGKQFDEMRSSRPRGPLVARRRFR